MSLPSRSITVPIDKSKAGLQSISSSSFTSLVKTASSRSSNASVLQLSNILANNAAKFINPLFFVITRYITDTTLYFGWANYELGYEISYSLSPGIVTKQNFTKAVRELSLTGLTPDTNYTFTVLPSTSKIPIIFTYRTFPDSRIVQNLAIKPLSANSIELSYSRPIPASDVIVYYRSSLETAFNTALNLQSLSGLQPSLPYTIYTRAIINNEEAPPSREVTFTLSSIPTAITVTVSDIATASVTLSYTKPQGVDYVRVYYKAVLDNGYLTGEGLTSLSDLNPATSYQVYVTLVINEVEYSPSIPVDFATITVPSVITNLNVSNITHSSATLTYTPPGRVTFVRVYYKKSTDVNYASALNIDSLSGLTPLTDYLVYVTSIVNGREYSPSTVETFRTLASPGVAGDVRARNITTHSATILYDLPTGATNGKIFYRRAIDDNYSSVDDVPGVPDLTSLTANTLYDVYVVAMENGRSWPNSAVIQFRTLGSADAVNDLVLTSYGINYVKLNYTKQAGATIRIFFKPVGASYLLTRDNASILGPLESGIRYEIYVVMLKNGGQSPPSPTLVYSVPIPPGPVRDLRIQDITQTSATLNYSPVDGATHLMIYYKKARDYAYSNAADLTELSGLEPFTAYNVYIGTFVIFQRHATSDTVTFTTLPSPSIISDLALSEISHNSVMLSYTKPNHVSSVKVYYKPSSASIYTIVPDITMLSGLTPSTTYTIFVSSVVDGTEILPDNLDLIKQFSTLSSTNIVQNLTTSEVTNISAIINYTFPAGATGVNLYYKQSTDNQYTLRAGTGTDTLPGLTGSVTYNVYTRAVIGGVEQGISPVTQFTTLYNPDIINDFVVTGVWDTGISYTHTNRPGRVWIKGYWRKIPEDSSGYGIRRATWEPTSAKILQSLFTHTSTYAMYLTDIRSVDGVLIESPPSKIQIFTTTPVSATISNLAVSNISHNSATLSYTNLAGANSVNVYYKKSSEVNYNVGVNLTNLSGLDVATTYFVFVKSVTNNVESQQSVTRSFTTLAAPTTVSNIRISDIGATSAKVSYTNLPGATSVNVYYKRYSSANLYPWIGIESFTNLTTFSSLLPSTSYEVYIASVTGTAESAPSSIQSFTTLASDSFIPNLLVSSVSNTTAELSFQITPPVGYVRIYYKKTTDASYLNGLNLSTLSSLLPSTEYQVYATAGVGGLETAGSNVQVFTTLANATFIDDFRVTNIGINSVTLSYSNLEGADNVKVYYRKIGDSSNTIGFRLQTLTSLQASTDYQIYITSITGPNESSPSPIRTFRTLDVPIPVDGLNVSTITYDSATLSYNKPSGVSSVKINYRKVGDASYIGIPTSLSSIDLVELQPSTQYQAFVILYVNGQEYNPSNPITFETLALPSTINDLAPTKITVSSVTLRYTRPAGSSEDVNIYYKKISESNYRRVTTQFKVLYGLARSTEYNVYCTFIISGVESLMKTNTITFATNSSPGSTLGGLVINDLTPAGSTADSISLSYTLPATRSYPNYHTVIFYRKVGTDTEFRSVINASTIYGLQPSTTYEVFAASKFIIENFSALNDPSPVILITTLPNSTIITDLSVRTLSYNFATIFYTKPSDADVRVYCKKSTDASYSNGLNLRTLSGLLPATSYNLYVRVVKGNDEGSPSNVLSFNTLSLPTSITNLALKKVTHNSAIISYTNIPGANSVMVYCKKSTDASYSNGLNLETLSGLEASTTYQVYVTSLTGSTESAPSAVQSFKTLASASTLPIVLLTPIDSSNSVTSFTTSVRYVISKPLNIVSYDIEVTSFTSS